MAEPESGLSRRMDNDDDWVGLREQWLLRPGVVYLNHGSFGPPPRAVAEARNQWVQRLDSQPMDFFVRQFEPAWCAARDALGQLIGASSQCLALVENATYGMNVVAQSFRLHSGDEVLLTDHEYGAVHRIWTSACQQQDAVCRQAALPLPLTSPNQVVEAIVSSLKPRTRLLVVSHITSATALVLPVAEIIAAVKPHGVAVCVDGPHAIAQLPLQLESLGCDFYTGSCHKWLSAPFGTGFLFASPTWAEVIRPALLSWGRLPPTTPQHWSDELMWTGTRNPSAMLAIPDAIQWLANIGWENFRCRTRWLANYAAEQLNRRFGLPSLAQPASDWYGSMAHCQLPPGPTRSLQQALWERSQVEAPIIDFAERRWIRVSCHLYNTASEIDQLVEALSIEIEREGI